MYDHPHMKVKSKKRTPHTCPRCQHPVRRVHRTAFDHFINLVRPVKRLQCSQCGWSGLIFRQQLRRHRRERVNPEVLRRQMQLTALIIIVLIGIALVTWYLTVFVWSTPGRQASGL